MDKIILGFIICQFFFSSCQDAPLSGKSEMKLRTTQKICNNLYREIYEISSEGAHGGEILSAYCTDSINFRKHIGVYSFSDESIGFRCKNDSIFIYKFANNGNDSMLQKVYSIKCLTEENIFE